jgi:hypothetical protein
VGINENFQRVREADVIFSERFFHTSIQLIFTFNRFNSIRLFPWESPDECNQQLTTKIPEKI